MKPWMWIALAAAGYSLYQKNKTNQWPWESTALAPSSGGGQWTVTVYDASREMLVGASQWGSEVDARAKAQMSLAACPTCKVTITNPSDNVVYQANG